MAELIAGLGLLLVGLILHGVHVKWWNEREQPVPVKKRRVGTLLPPTPLGMLGRVLGLAGVLVLFDFVWYAGTAGAAVWLSHPFWMRAYFQRRVGQRKEGEEG